MLENTACGSPDDCSLSNANHTPVQGASKSSLPNDIFSAANSIVTD